MAKSVYDGFMEYLKRLEPHTVELDARSRHRTTIEQALAAEFPSYNRVVVFGSHTRSTAIRHFSDVDYMAVLGSADVTRAGSWVTSTTTLGRVKGALEARFPSTPVRVDGPAAIVQFGGGNGAVDVTPAVWAGMSKTEPKRPVFYIPDGGGAWIETAPDLHDMYLRHHDEDKARGKLTRTVRLLKGWKYARSPSIPLSGFHAELLLASEDTCVRVDTYQECLRDAFRLVRDRGGAAINDPIGVAGRVEAVRSTGQRLVLAEAARYAVEKCESAITAELRHDLDAAFRYWDLVFNGDFPAR